MTVYGMHANVGRNHQVTFKVKGNSQIPFDYDRINGSVENGGKAMDFVGAQSRIKRIHLEDLPGAAHRRPLLTRQFFEIAPELGLSNVAVSHQTGG
jgi:hypothetical protein